MIQLRYVDSRYLLGPFLQLRPNFRLFIGPNDGDPLIQLLNFQWRNAVLQWIQLQWMESLDWIHI